MARERDNHVRQGMEKAYERRVAKAVGGRRIPVTGERNGVDVDAGPFVYQVKLRRGVPGYLRDWLRGITGQAETLDRLGDEARPMSSVCTGVVVWKAPGDRDEDAVVVLRFRDWVDLHGA